MPGLNAERCSPRMHDDRVNLPVFSGERLRLVGLVFARSGKQWSYFPERASNGATRGSSKRRSGSVAVRNLRESAEANASTMRQLRVLLRVLGPNSLSFSVLPCALVSLCVPHRLAMQTKCGVLTV